MKLNFIDLKMQKSAAALTTICILLCFAFNYTFPLHRQTASADNSYANGTQNWDDFLHYGFIFDRSKKMVNDMENTIHKLKKSAQDLIRPHEKCLKREMDNKLSEEDLRQYEQLVIMKKYPYLDLKELEPKYSPLSTKNTRQSFRFESDANLRSDNSLEPEEGINVEIINRGLSGFSIPPKLAKAVAMVDGKLKFNNLRINDDKSSSSVKKKSSKRETLGGLEKYIVEYEQKRNKKCV